MRLPRRREPAKRPAAEVLRATAENRDIQALEDTRDVASAPPPGERRLSLLQNVSWSFAGTLVHAGCKWGSLVVLAKLGGPEAVGTLALGLALIAPVFMFFNLQLREIQTTDAKGHYSFGTIWGVRLVSSALALLLMGGYSIFASRDPSLVPVLLLLAAGQAFESLSDAIHGRIQRQERLDWIARSMAARGVLGLGLLSGGYLIAGSLPIAVAGLALSSLLPLIAFDLPLLRRLEARRAGLPLSAIPPIPKPVFPRQELSRLFRSALPLGGTMMLVSLQGNLPRYFIEGHLGRGDLGIFAAMAQLVAAGSLAISAAAQAASPRLAILAHGAKIDEFRKVSFRLYQLVFAVSAGGILLALAFGPEILTLVFRPEFAEASSVLVLLAVGGAIGFAAAVPGFGMTAAGAHGVQFPLFLAVNVVAVIAAGLLVPWWGLEGAAVGVILANFAQLLGSRLVLRRRLKAIEAVQR